MRKIVLFLLICMFFFSCKEEKHTNNSLKITVDLHQRNEFSLTKMFSRIEIVPLETTTESLFNDIRYLKLVNGKNYILDIKGKVLLVFDNRGKFIFKIDRLGEGPGEYIHINDFFVDQKKKIIELIEPIHNALYQYDLEGKFIQTVPLPKITGAYGNVCALDDDILVFFTYDYRNRIKYYSRKEGKIVYEAYPEGKLDNFCTFNFIGKNLFCRSLKNQVYQLNTNGVVLAYEWDFGVNNNDLSRLQRPSDPEKSFKFDLSIINSEIVNYAIGVQASCSSFHYAKLIRKHAFIHILYNTKSKQTLVFDKTIEGLDFYPIEMTDEYVLGVHAPGEINKVVSPEILSEEEQIKLKAIEPDDNPALIKYYF